MRNRTASVSIAAIWIVFLLTSGMAFAQIDNGYQKKTSRTKQTVEPAFTIIEPTIETQIVLTVDGREMGAAMFTGDERAEVDASGDPCTPKAIDACWFFCEQQLEDPFCCQLGSWCEQDAFGGAKCHCGYMCARDSGGVQHKPKRLIPPSETIDTP